MRVNLSVAIVYMASDFDWDEKTNGVILGMFFYGYVLTQVIHDSCLCQFYVKYLIISEVPGGRMAELLGGKWLFGVGEVTFNVITSAELAPDDVRGSDYRSFHPGHPRGGQHQPHSPLRSADH